MSIEIKRMRIDDYERMIALWKVSEGVELSNADAKEHIASFLERNPGLSLVAYDGEQLVGTALCGHDGRRGYIHHLAVAETHRRQSIGRRLVEEILHLLKQCRIDKCHLFVVKANREGRTFWEQIGWEERVDLVIMSRLTP